jgi:excisionase family DNA binding protein
MYGERLKQVPTMSTPKRQSKAPNPSALLTTKEAAAIAGVRVRRVRKWVEAKHLRAVQRRPKMLIDRRDLDAFLHNRKQATDADDASQASELVRDDTLMAKDLNPSKHLTVIEAAAVAGVHRATIAKWIARGDLRVVQREPQLSIEREDLDQFLRHRKKRPADARDASPTSPLTLEEAAELASVHRTTIGNWIASGKLRAVQRKPYTLIEREDLEQFLHKQKAQADAANPLPAKKVPPIAKSPQITVDRPTENPPEFSVLSFRPVAARVSG